MKSCWNQEYKTRPHASEIADFLANSPRLLAPCLDVPISSVQLDYPRELDILPELFSKHHLPIAPLPDDFEANKENDSTLINSLRFDNPNYITGEINANKNTSSNNNRKPNFKNEFIVERITDEEEMPFV